MGPAFADKKYLLLIPVINGFWLPSTACAEPTFTISASDGSVLNEGKLHGSPSQAAFYNPPPKTPAEGGLDQAKVGCVFGRRNTWPLLSSSSLDQITLPLASLCFPAQFSLVIDKSRLYLFNMKDPEAPTELAFQDRYGTIVAYEWYVLWLVKTSVLFASQSSTLFFFFFFFLPYFLLSFDIFFP